MTLKIKTAFFSHSEVGFEKNSSTAICMHRHAENDKVEQIWQTVKMNELFSPTGLASQILLYDHVDHIRFHHDERGCQMVQLLSAYIVGPTMFVNMTPALSFTWCVIELSHSDLGLSILVHRLEVIRWIMSYGTSIGKYIDNTALMALPALTWVFERRLNSWDLVIQISHALRISVH